MTFVWVLAVSAAVAPVKLAMPAFSAVGVDAQQVTALSEHFSLKVRGVSVLTQREMSSIIGLERQRQLMGCSGDTSCVTELANALGVDGIVLGDLTRIGSQYQLNVKVVSSQDGRRLAAFSERVEGEGELFGAFERAARAIEQETLSALGRGGEAAASTGFSRAWAAVPGVAAVGLLVTGVFLKLGAESDYALLKASTPPASGASGLSLKQSGEQKQWGAIVSLSVGVAAAAAAVALLVLGGSPSSGLALAPGPDGSVFVVWTAP